MIYHQRNSLTQIQRAYLSIITQSRKEKFIKRFTKVSEDKKDEEGDRSNSTLSKRFPRGNLKPKEGDCSVLVPLVDIDDKSYLIYTKRSMTMRTHKGQICFPGGRLDPNETWEMAALREAEEEINLKSHYIDIWTAMRPIVDRRMTNTIVPIVGEITNPDGIKNFYSATDEVDVVMAVPIKELVTNHHYTFFKVKFSFTLPCYHSRNFKVLYSKDKNYTKPEKYIIWGLTGVITHQFLLYFTPEVYKPKVHLPF